MFELSDTGFVTVPHDGHVNVADVVAMEQALANRGVYEAAHGHLSDAQLSLLGDVNGDGNFNNSDLQSLINLLQSGGGSTNPVAEPSTFVLVVLAVLMLTTVRKID